MRGFLKMAGIMALLWAMIPLGPRLEPVLDRIIPRLVLPIGVGCVLGVVAVYVEIAVKGLRALRREAERAKRNPPSVAA